MTERILVAYASKYGATKEIAERVAGVLKAEGCSVDLLDAGDVTDISAYQYVVLGSAMYIGQWHKPAMKFLKRHVDALAAKEVWTFCSGPTEEGDPAALLDDWKPSDKLQELLDRIKPHTMTIFAGVMQAESMSGFDRFIVNKIGVEQGDYRDWDAIETWAREVAAAIKAKQTI